MKDATFFVSDDFQHHKRSKAVVHLEDGKLRVTVMEDAGWTKEKIGEIFGNVDIEVRGCDIEAVGVFRTFYIRGWAVTPKRCVT